MATEKTVNKKQTGGKLYNYLDKSKLVAKQSSTAVNTLPKLNANQLSDNRAAVSLEQFRSNKREEAEKRTLLNKGQTPTSNFFSDLGTTMLKNVTEFRQPDAGELEKGREGWAGRSELIRDGIAYGLGNELVGGAMGALGNKLSRLSMKSVASKGTVETVRNSDGSIYHFLGPDPVKKKPLLEKGKEKLNEILEKKFIPAGNKRILPEKLEFKMDAFDEGYEGSTGFHIRAVDPKTNARYGYLGLQPHPERQYVVNGIPKSEEFINANARDVFRLNPSYGYVNDIKTNMLPSQWTSPTMISVEPALQGKRFQDVLYQKGIEESKKLGFKGVRSGDELMSPYKTAKAHERFDRQVFDMKETDGIEHGVVGLTQHKNPNVIDDWMREYANIKKVQKQKLSFNDIGKTIKDNKEEAGLIAGATGILGGIGYAAKKLYEKDRDFREVMSGQKINK